MTFTQGGPAVGIVECDDAACAGNDETTTLIQDVVGSSIAIGTDRNPVLSYNVYGTGANVGPVKVVRCNDPACAGGDDATTTLDDSGIDQTSAIIGIDGAPLVLYTISLGSELRLARPPIAGRPERRGAAFPAAPRTSSRGRAT